jgi:hypothetical protein
MGLKEQRFGDLASPVFPGVLELWIVDYTCGLTVVFFGLFGRTCCC